MSKCGTVAYHSEQSGKAGMLLAVFGNALLQLFAQLHQPGVHVGERPERAGPTERLPAADGLRLLPWLHL